MSYKIIIDNRAKREIKKVHQIARNKILKKINMLAYDPRPPNVVKLTNKDNLYRVRCNDYRIVYQTKDRTCLILIIAAGHRKEVYKNN